MGRGIRWEDGATPDQHPERKAAKTACRWGAAAGRPMAVGDGRAEARLGAGDSQRRVARLSGRMPGSGLRAVRAGPSAGPGRGAGHPASRVRALGRCRHAGAQPDHPVVRPFSRRLGFSKWQALPMPDVTAIDRSVGRIIAGCLSGKAVIRRYCPSSTRVRLTAPSRFKRSGSGVTYRVFSRVYRTCPGPACGRLRTNFRAV